MQTYIQTPSLPTAATRAPACSLPPFASLQPNFECRERKDHLTLTVYVPGVEARGIAVEHSGADLTVTARKPRPVRANWHALQLETAQRDYQLCLRLGRDLDYAALQTRLRYGILTVTLPKMAATGISARHAA